MGIETSWVTVTKLWQRRTFPPACDSSLCVWEAGRGFTDDCKCWNEGRKDGPESENYVWEGDDSLILNSIHVLDRDGLIL